MSMGGLPRPWQTLIRGPKDLITSPESIIAGFSEQAEVKASKASEFTARARELRLALQEVQDVSKLLEITAFRSELIAAAHFSQKASHYFTSQQLADAIMQVFHRVYEDCQAAYGAKGEAEVQSAFRDEIVSRYLLTAGATFDGQMRNWTGANAQDKVVAALLAALDQRGIRPQAEEEPKDTGVQVDISAGDDADAELEVAKSETKRSKFHWPGRLLLFNIKPKLVWGTGIIDLNNIDMVLLNTNPPISEADLKQKPDRYLACGELKGGIDPAGADEHWKTARTALDRIHKSFTDATVQPPALFFIGAVIVTKMADEINERLIDGTLSYAANLTNGAQLEAFTDWLTSL